MTSEHLRQTRDAAPFLPFIIHMTDGRSFRVPHRDYLLLLPHGRIAIVARPDSEAFDILDVMHITRLEVDPSPTSAATGTDTHGA